MYMFLLKNNYIFCKYFLIIKTKYQNCNIFINFISIKLKKAYAALSYAKYYFSARQAMQNFYSGWLNKKFSG